MYFEIYPGICAFPGLLLNDVKVLKANIAGKIKYGSGSDKF